MRRKNKVQTDYTLAYLRFLAGFRASPPSSWQYGLSPEEAAKKRREVDACLGRTGENTIN